MQAKNQFFELRETAPLTTGQMCELEMRTMRHLATGDYELIPPKRTENPLICAQNDTDAKSLAKVKKPRKFKGFAVYKINTIAGQNDEIIFTHKIREVCQNYAAAQNLIFESEFIVSNFFDFKTNF